MSNLKNKVLLGLAGSLFSVSLNALDLDQAIKIAIDNNHELKAKSFDYEQSLQDVQINKTSYLPKLDLSHSYSKYDEVNQGQNKENANFNASISYNLFNGFIDKSNLESSRFLSKASKYDFNALKQDIILNTKKAYINYLDKKNALDTYNVEYELFEKQFNDAKNRYSQGLLARNDLLQVEVNTLSAKQNVVRAKADVKIAKLELSNILGGLDLSQENIKNLKDFALKIAKFTKKQALENRSEIKALKMNLESLRKQQKAKKGTYLPKLDALVSHNRFYKDLGLSSVDTGLKDQNVAKLNASWNLYNGGKNKIEIAKFRVKMAKLKEQLSSAQLNIKLQFENAKSNLEVANDNFKTSSLALIQAKENYKIVKNRFNEGISTSTDLTDANFLLTSAKQKYYKSYFDKYISIATLQRVVEN